METLASKPQRLCVWCQGEGLSGEHFWPQWSAAHVAYGGTGRKRSLYTRINLDTPVSEPEVRESTGKLGNLKLRLVCERCNNEWMSGCETAAQPHLIPMIAGGTCTLDVDAQRAVANWCVLKAMLAEPERPELAVCPQADREAFKATRAIPDYIEVHVGRHGLNCTAAYQRDAQTMFVDDGTPPAMVAGEPIKNIMVTTWVIGTLFVVVFASRSNRKASELFHIGDRLAPRIWPQNGSVLSWPPPVTMTQQHTSAIAHILEDMVRANNRVWAPHPHERLPPR